MAGPRPRVDVGIVCWNTRDLTLDALERLHAAGRDVDLRVLVRDNGSVDGTAAAVRDRFPGTDVQVGDNVGFAAGVNALLARSDAPWFVTLNSDAWPEPGALGALVALAAREPRAAAVAPLVLRPDGALEHSTHPLPSLRVAAAGVSPRAVRGRERELCLAGGWAHDATREVGWAVGAALLLRREALDALGGLDESLFMYAEDLEWCWRARRAGWQIWFEPAAVVRHVGNASGAQRWGSRREQVAVTNANRVVRRYAGTPRAL
ncbi:MAG: glycosyltransferase family 2 protein, partial [Nocardioidaceae bacterium]